MVYDFTTDIENLTREDNLTTAVIDWAVYNAKTFYICDDGNLYDDSVSNVDNFLISILASAFVLLYVKSLEVPAEFSLDEFSLKENAAALERATGRELNRYFSMFFSWLELYQSRGCDLQYVDNGTLLEATDFSATDLIAALTVPEGITQ